MALVETHISGEQAQKICDKIGFSGQSRVDAQGFAGGIWLLWKEEIIEVTVLDNHSQHITVEIKKRDEDPWIFSAIYASLDSTSRKELWRELENISRAFTRPWMLAGDFNDTMSMSERIGVGGSEMERRCKDFSDWVNDNHLIDLGSSGPVHTWSRGLLEATYKAARLDRALVKEELRLRFDEGVVRNLTRITSDHCPILINLNGFTPIPKALKPFRFQAAWLKHETFEEFVCDKWNNSETLIPFLKTFAGELSTWNKEKFHNIFRKKSEQFARLKGIQRAMARGAPIHLLIEADLKKKMNDVLEQEELLWFQKLRTEAICDGDRNTLTFTYPP
ncbi:uncharacterized protein LOC110722030 [Chenopodium quinoa]|uniref:uncharacterized protein LOC110722030 n=1 Tax=Chenopodium quinoa TaxID=63459 RepID=UPI000B7839DD|nr:uncharacterized protein LOC110722030 [Chenopodium quinoa]